MTRLERDDAYLRSFESVLETARQDDRGGWWRLRESAFYATGGGQPHAEGTLALEGAQPDTRRWRVAEVEADDAGVWHRVTPEPSGDDTALDATIPVAGTALRGEIDWPRRFAQMQRHTAQHLVSQTFVRLNSTFGTRAVALGSADVTLDLAGEPDEAAVAEAFALVNQVAAQALPIEAFEVDEAELRRYPLRRPAKVRGRVRLVRMGDWEVSACGGTHLRSTAEALPILSLGRERIRGGLVRITFRAGLEAIARASATQAAAAAAARSLSTSVDALPERVLALQEEAAGARRTLAHARQALAAARAQALAPTAGGVVAVLLTAEEAPLITDLADALAARGVSAVVGAPQGDKGALVLTSGAGVDVRPALRAGLAELDGRGGGKPERAQGAGPARDRLEAAVQAAAHVLEDM